MSHKDVSQECLARVSSSKVLKCGNIRVRGPYQVFTVKARHLHTQVHIDNQTNQPAHSSATANIRNILKQRLAWLHVSAEVKPKYVEMSCESLR